jgi:hypothetical protein
MVAPVIDDRPPYRRSHRRRLTTTPRAVARSSSLALKRRPISGRVPSTSNRFDEMMAYWTFSGSQSPAAHPPVTLKRESLNEVQTASDWNDRARSRRSRKFGSDSGSCGNPLVGL